MNEYKDNKMKWNVINGINLLFGLEFSVPF